MSKEARQGRAVCMPAPVPERPPGGQTDNRAQDRPNAAWAISSPRIQGQQYTHHARNNARGGEEEGEGRGNTCKTIGYTMCESCKHHAPIESSHRNWGLPTLRLALVRNHGVHSKSLLLHLFSAPRNTRAANSDFRYDWLTAQCLMLNLLQYASTDRVERLM